MDAASFSVAMTNEVDAALARHLLRVDQQEDICFALWYPSTGAKRTSALIRSIVLPEDGERNIHGNASFNPAYFERSLVKAASEGAGLALLHSHPFGVGWQQMSADDVAAELEHAAATYGATNLPLAGLTLASDRTWSARMWQRTGRRQYQRVWCKSVRVVGEQLKVSYNDELLPAPPASDELRRTISAWGKESQNHLVRLKVGVAGIGSVGGMIAESLARTGFVDVTVIDFDAIERHNLDRLIYATERDIGKHKVDVLAARLKETATGKSFSLNEVKASVCDDHGFKAALDCDIIFSCVDRPRGRHVLNSVAYAHLIPVIDGGIAVRTNRSAKIISADWRAHVAIPGRPCLQCLGQYLPSDAQLEREGLLDDPRYIEGLPRDHHLKASENVFAFSMSCASLQMLQMLAMVIAPLGLSNGGAQIYHFVGTFMENADVEACQEECLMTQLTAYGDTHPIPIDTTNEAAQTAPTIRVGVDEELSPLHNKSAIARLCSDFWRAFKKRFGKNTTST